jgi:adenylate cyclase
MENIKQIKSRFKYYRLTNAVLIGNLIVVLIGDQLSEILFQHRAQDTSERFLSLVYYMDLYFGIIALFVMAGVTIWYERPIRQSLKQFYKDRQPDIEVLKIARKRILNEPYMIVALDAAIWGAGSFIFWAIGIPASISIASGLITMMLAFFWVEHVTQHNLVPQFFPDGGLSMVKGVKSISLRVRFAALIFAVSIVPLTFIHLTIHRFRDMRMMDEITLLMLLNRIEKTVAVESIIFMVVGIGLSWLVLKNLKRPVGEIIRVMEEVRQGNFKEKVKVYTNDELGFAGETLNAMTEGLKERELIKDIFGKYVDRQVRDEILKGKIPLDGEMKQATILFADLRNFTPLVAVTPPKKLIYVLNAYFNEMANAIKSHGGLILQFIGDEVEAVFGAPVHLPDHELAAVKTARDMHRRMTRLNKIFEDQGIHSIAHGVGIHTGPVLAANIGSADRSAYSLIGDTVNLASRIQGLTKEFKTDILVSSQVRNILSHEYDFRPMPEIRVKGKPDPVQVFSLDYDGS